MKILMLANKYPYPAEDGSSMAIMNMLEGLAREASITLFALNTSKHRKASTTLPDHLLSRVSILAPQIKTDITPLGILANLIDGRPYHCSRFINSETSQALSTLLQNETFDIIQLETAYMGVYFETIKKHSKAKVVLRAHNAEGMLWLQNAEKAPTLLHRQYLNMQARRLSAFETKLCKEVDAIVSISEIDSTSLQKKAPETPIQTTPFGVQAHLYEVHPGNQGTVGFFGSLDWLPNQQGLEWLLETVWPIVSSKINGVLLDVAGKHLPENFRKYASEVVRFSGFVPQLQSYLNTCEIVVVPILSGSGIRIKMIEAMASGKAIVSTQIGAMGIPGKSGRDYLIADTPEAFAKAIILLLNDPEKRAEIGKNARLLVEQQLDNNLLTNNLLSFYKSL
jgi:polysaccharide biosynthesis protein PslH